MRTLTVVLASALVLPTSVAAAVPLDSYAAEVDIDGDGQIDSIGVTSESQGRQTVVELTLADGRSAQTRLPWRGADPLAAAGNRFEGVSPLRTSRQKDLVMRIKDGDCGSYRVMRWSGDDLETVARPEGGKNWKVCALGVSKVGWGYRVVAGKRKSTLFAFRAKADGDSEQVRLRTTRYRWQNGAWQKISAKKKRATANALLNRWGLDFPWRNS